VADARVQTFSGQLFTVTRAGDVVIIARSHHALGSGRLLEQALTQMRTEVQRAASGHAHGLIYDFRKAPSRNDPEFEQAFARARSGIAIGFTRVAFLMSGTLGKLQAQRYARDDGQGAQAFLNEKLALAFAGPASRGY
jgi:hypothetical protein